MKTKHDVVRLASRFGAELLIHDDRPIDCEVMAPHGHHWIEDELHSLVGHQLGSAGDVWQDLYDRMLAGVEPCHNSCSFWGNK